jgi:hypothetical protein
MFPSPPPKHWQKESSWKFVIDVLRKESHADDNLYNGYNVDTYMIKRLHLWTIWKHFDSVVDFLWTYLPEYEKCKLNKYEVGQKRPRFFWDDANCKQAFEVLLEKIEFETNFENIYSISYALLRHYNYDGLLQKFGTIHNLVKTFLSAEQFKRIRPEKFGKTPVQEVWVIHALRNDPNWILWGADSLDYILVRFTADDNKRNNLRLDVVALHIPTNKVCAFEIDGEQHFYTISDFHENLSIIHERDVRKLGLLKEGCNVPCTSGRQIDHLFRISYKYRRVGPDSMNALLKMSHNHCINNHTFWNCLEQDRQMYDNDGIPIIL